MKTLGVTLVAAAAVGLATLGVAKPTTAQSDRPGKIVCPHTGELICRDKCSTVDPNRPDCPGRIACPLTGEMVCKDRCPLENKAAAPEAGEQDVKSCCSRKD